MNGAFRLGVNISITTDKTAFLPLPLCRKAKTYPKPGKKILIS
jgi:hypothetical protein